MAALRTYGRSAEAQPPRAAAGASDTLADVRYHTDGIKTATTPEARAAAAAALLRTLVGCCPSLADAADRGLGLEVASVMESMSVSSHQRGPSAGDFQLHWSHSGGGDSYSAVPSPAEAFEDRECARTLLLVMYVLLSPRCGAALDLLTPASVNVCLRVLSDSLSRQSSTDRDGEQAPAAGSRERAEASTDAVQKDASARVSGVGGGGYGKRPRQSTDWLSFGQPGSPAIKRARSLPAELSGGASTGSSAFDGADDGPCKLQINAAKPSSPAERVAATRRLSSSSSVWNAAMVEERDQLSFAAQAEPVFAVVPPYGPCAALLVAHAPPHAAVEGREATGARSLGRGQRPSATAEEPDDRWADLALFLLHRLVAVDEASEAAATADGDGVGSSSSGRRFELALAERVRATRLAALSQRVPWPHAAGGAAALKAAPLASTSGSGLLCAVIARALPGVAPDAAVRTDATPPELLQPQMPRLQAALLVAEDLSLVAAAASESALPSAAAAGAAAGSAGASTHIVEFLTASPAGLTAAADAADSRQPSTTMGAVLLQAAEQLFDTLRRPRGGPDGAAAAGGDAAAVAGGAAAAAIVAGTLCELWHSCLRVLVNCTNNSVRGAELLLDAVAPSPPSAPHAQAGATVRGGLSALSLLSPARGSRAPGPALFRHLGVALAWARGTLGAAGGASGARVQAFDSAVLCLGLLGNTVEHSQRAQALLLSSSSSSSSSSVAAASASAGNTRALLSPTARAAAAGPESPAAAAASAAAQLAEQPPEEEERAPFST